MELWGPPETSGVVGPQKLVFESTLYQTFSSLVSDKAFQKYATKSNNKNTVHLSEKQKKHDVSDKKKSKPLDASSNIHPSLEPLMFRPWGPAI